MRGHVEFNSFHGFHEQMLGPKGVRALEQEDPPWGILASPGDLEESGSHRII